MYRFLILLFISVITVSCWGRRSQAPKTTIPPRSHIFLPPIVPPDLTPEEARDYLRNHYWDDFNFTDTVQFRLADTIQMIETYARWIMAISDTPQDSSPMDSLMRKASISRPMLDYFAMMADEVVHDPNSPLRNDEFFIPVMEAVTSSPFYDEYERIAPEYELNLARQNRVGQKANDFRYTLISGATGTLYGTKANYTLIFFHNPGCPLCREVRGQINSSPMLQRLIERGELKVIALYADEDLKEWRKDYHDIPSKWINGYDAGSTIRENSTYNLKAIPSLYLLDRDKKVLVKDSADVPYIEEVIDRRS